MRDYELIVMFCLGAIAGLLVAGVAFENPRPVKLITQECYTQTIKDSSILHRVSCPKGVK